VRNYADQVMGNLLVEGAMPILFHEDPRYFRRGQGAVWSRIGYATSRVFVTRTDSGGTEFDYSELVGSSLAVGISKCILPRKSKLGRQLPDAHAAICDRCSLQCLEGILARCKAKAVIAASGKATS
jgi:hypothetical protein